MQPMMSTAIVPASAGRLAFASVPRLVRPVREDSREDESLSRLGVVMSVKPGEIILFEGDRAEHVYEVRGGMVRACRLMADGRRHISSFLGEGDLVGLNAASFYPYTAEAVTAATLVRYPRAGLDAMTERSASFARRLLATACRELEAARDQMLLLGRKRAEERIATFLLAMSRRQIAAGESGDPLHLPMSRTDIADYLGLTIETVSRTLSQLRRDGVIDLPSTQSVVFRDMEALSDLAGSSSGDG